VKGWIGDFFRAAWAFSYWNARKSLYVLRRRRGQCPCHNPSDSGEPMRTGCEAVAGWAKPARFQRVCPLLRRNEEGFWVCSVRAAQVRPFWGRACAHYGTALAVTAALAVLVVFGGLRGIGYQVTLRQVAWPPAWHELREVRAEFFVAQARASYAKGQVRDAINALSIAYQLNPKRYEVGMMLAQFYQAGNPVHADALYHRLLGEHPERSKQTARVWFTSLLARGRLRDVAGLARRQLAAEPEQAAAWSHALLFATRHLRDDKPLEEARADPGTPAAARAVIDLALRVRALPRPAARRLLLSEPLVTGFPYDGVYRIEALLRRGYPLEALEVISKLRPMLAGRDVARLIFAAYAQSHNTKRLEQGFAGLLAPDRALNAAEVTLLAVHLVDYPDADLLRQVVAALPRVLNQEKDAGLEAATAVFCAAGVLADEAVMNQVQKKVGDTFAINPTGMQRLELFFLEKSPVSHIGTLLPAVKPLSLELCYALLDRYEKP
jgi:hypothetical protein